MSTKRSYKAGDKLLLEGTYGEESFLILAGNVQVYKEVGTKDPVVLAELGPGEVLGEMYLFKHAGFRSASALALSEVEVQVITRPEIEKELENTPQIIQDMICSLDKRLEGTSQDYSIARTRKFNWEQIFNKLVITLLVSVLIAQAILYLQASS